ncbi:TRAP transporter permease [Nocardiopsis quinghaiensis]|uniref:TRAP transporter permease n=1 Tax=Nocardiopsis quinghaiensis TaxID=464995 RepID=UPI0012396C97|nr:TRAP transporter fused permease subunit [Nocardiopsis quinghaiensis]
MAENPSRTRDETPDPDEKGDGPVGALPGAEEDGPADPAWRRIAVERWGEGRTASVVGVAILVLAAALTLFQLYIALRAGFDAQQQRLIHLMFVMVLVFLAKPVLPGGAGRSVPALVLDLVLIAATVAVSLYPMVLQAELASRAGAYTDTDWVMGLTAIVLLLEATRRAVGTVMVVMVAAFVLYAWIGPLIPGRFGHSGATIQRIATHSYLGDGVYGLTLGVVVTFVFVFILFGALLSKTGGGSFFVGLAYVLTGRMVGGPAKGAVLGSALMGSVSGSAIANVVSTGPFTIPLMRRVGYRRHDAAGVEAAASTGGQILPPIMGAGAFIMAERTGIPYADIVKVAIIPALMYFGVMFLFVDILARKHAVGLTKDSELPTLRAVMGAGWHFLAPLVLLITLLINYVPPTQAGLYACGALLLVAMLRAGSRLSPRDFLEVFVLAARNTMPVSVACAVAGVIVGMVGLTGLGLVLSDVLVTAFAGSLLLTLLMVAFTSLIMGIGLPVTAAYVVLAVLAVPALQELGLAVIVAHMIVYWYSQDSNVTPPVAFAAFAAAGIANAKPMRAGLSAWKFAKGLYLIPMLMAYTALLTVAGPVTDLATAVVSGCVALAAAAIAIEGHFLRRAMPGERLALALAAALVMVAPEWSNLFRWALSASVDPGWFTLAGSVLGAALIALQVVGHRLSRRAGSTAEPTDPAPGAERRDEAAAGK